MNRKPSRKSKAKKANQYAQPMLPVYLAPPHYKPQEVRSWKVRYRAAAAITSQAFTCSELGRMLALYADSAIACHYICNQYRLKRVCIWGPVATAGTPVAVTAKYSDIINATTGFTGCPQTVSDESVSFDRPAYVCLTPPKDSIVNLWQSVVSTNNFIEITCPSGSIIDFDYQFYIDDIGSLPLGPVIAAGTPFTIFHLTVNNLTAVLPLNLL